MLGEFVVAKIYQASPINLSNYIISGSKVMAKITKETVEYVARLASLKFDPKQLETYTKKFASVLEYVEKLNKVDTKGIEPTSHAIEGISADLREDKAVKFSAVDEILNNAPKKKGRLVEVPKVIE